MAYKALDVAEYIIWYENTQGRLTNNLRLAKQMYFLQVIFLANKKKPCYNEKLIALDFGPVVEEAYNEYLYYGCGVIPPDKFKNKINNLEDEQLMNDMLDCMSKYSTSALVQIVTKQDPWENAYHSTWNIDHEISHKSIVDYYCRYGD